MRALTAFILALGVTSHATGALADPHEPVPQKVDPNPAKADVTVLKDAKGMVYVIVDPWSEKDRVNVFAGTGKALYQQLGISASHSVADKMMNIGLWAPRIPEFKPGLIHLKDGVYSKECYGADDSILTELTGPKAAEVMKATFYTPYLTRASMILGRDDTAIYYYVDHLREPYGKEGYRLLVGKKGVMKELPLTDVAVDTDGDLFVTKTGTLKVVNEHKDIGDNLIETIPHLTWIKGERKTELTTVDVSANQQLVYGNLGVYQKLGTVCDDI